MRKTLTIKYLNDKIAKPLEVELVKGKGYFYLVGELMGYASTTSIYVYKVNDLSFEQWQESIKEIVSEAKTTRNKGLY